MKTFGTLRHVTDVGASQGNGADSTLRIKNQYQRLGVEVDVVSAGHSPLHVAFAGLTDLSSIAKERASKVLKLLKRKPPKVLPVALNSAPRNSDKTLTNGQEDYIYRVKSVNDRGETQLIYGPEVLKWVLAFRGRVGVTVGKILAITDIISNTSNGSQFRSGEHLPIVHFMEALGGLDEYSERENVSLDDIDEAFSQRTDNVVIAPPDEYLNGRLIVGKELFDKILSKPEIQIPEITSDALEVKSSLTQVTSGNLAVWPSSNHFPDPDIRVLNIGTRWGNGKTDITDGYVKQLIEDISKSVGKQYIVNL